ncbi:MAG TPA: FKBP-type peptidyl-prolyl cis-trans isomerase [Acidobacteriaceae bacterium]
MRTQTILLALAATTLAAATATAQATRPAVHRTTPVHRPAAVECAKLPELSPKIPALPAGTPCPKPLFTVTQTSSLHADYISPLVSPELRQMLAPAPIVISLVYADEKAGSGPLVEHGKSTDVLYTGYLVDGTTFDSSTDPAKPLSFVLGGHHVIPGWDMGLEGMHIGGKRRLFVPYQLAYGENGRGPIPPKAMLVFDIQVLNQTDAPPAPPAGAVAPRPPAPHLPPAAPHAPSPAGTAAPPPVNSTTPATSTQPTQPSSTIEPKK